MVQKFKEYLAESKTLKNQLSKVDYSRVLDVVSGKSELSDELYQKLYQILAIDMPYGTAKARTGDPSQWISDNLGKYVVESEVQSKKTPYEFGYHAHQKGIMCAPSRDKEFIEFCRKTEKQSKYDKEAGLPHWPSAGSQAGWRAGWHASDTAGI